MAGFGLRTLLCISWAVLPAMLCLFRRDRKSKKWLWAVGLWSSRWRRLTGFFSVELVGLVDALLVLDKGALGGALGHESVAAEQELAGVVVQVALASSEFGSFDSMPMPSGVELVSGDSSPFHPRIVLRRGHSISARVWPSPELVFKG